MEIGLAVQILSAIFQTLGTILGIGSAFYIYLLQAYKGRFLGWKGKEDDIRFESPSSSFWGFFGSTVGIMALCASFMFTTATAVFVGERLDFTIAVILLLSMVDLVFFGLTMKNFSEYPDKLRKLLAKYEVWETSAGNQIFTPKREN